MKPWFTLVVLLLTALSAHAEKIPIRQAWSKHYLTAPLPELPACGTAAKPERPTIDSVIAYTSPITTILLSDFICRFGLPSRHLHAKSKERSDYYIYDLPSGDAIALNVDGKQWGAIVIVSADGELIRLIK